jgi:hypothetical protein
MDPARGRKGDAPQKRTHMEFLFGDLETELSGSVSCRPQKHAVCQRQAEAHRG